MSDYPDFKICAHCGKFFALQPAELGDIEIGEVRDKLEGMGLEMLPYEKKENRLLVGRLYLCPKCQRQIKDWLTHGRKGEDINV